MNKEIERRRTFAIISHPDAGKTTQTKKSLKQESNSLLNSVTPKLEEKEHKKERRKLSTEEIKLRLIKRSHH